MYTALVDEYDVEQAVLAYVTDDHVVRRRNTQICQGSTKRGIATVDIHRIRRRVGAVQRRTAEDNVVQSVIVQICSRDRRRVTDIERILLSEPGSARVLCIQTADTIAIGEYEVVAIIAVETAHGNVATHVIIELHRVGETSIAVTEVDQVRARCSNGDVLVAIVVEIADSHCSSVRRLQRCH